MWVVAVVDGYMSSPTTTLNSLVREKLNFQWTKNSIDFWWGSTTDFTMQFSVNLRFKINRPFFSVNIFVMHEIICNASHFLSALTIFPRQHFFVNNFLLGDFRTFSKIIGQSGLVRFYSVLGFIWPGISKIFTVLVRVGPRFLIFFRFWSGSRFLFFLS